jgi:hypothetical protein
VAPALSFVLLAAACGDDDDTSADDVAEDASDAASDAAEDASDAVEEGGDDAAETAVRNLASSQGEDEFSAAGVEVEGDLTCEATTSGDAANMDVSCTGTGTDGQDLSMEGTTDELPGASVTELEGSFVGTADGEEVFNVDTLGG